MLCHVMGKHSAGGIMFYKNTFLNVLLEKIFQDCHTKVKVGNDQEMTQSDRNSHSKTAVTH